MFLRPVECFFHKVSDLLFHLDNRNSNKDSLCFIERPISWIFLVRWVHWVSLYPIDFLLRLLKTYHILFDKSPIEIPWFLQKESRDYFLRVNKCRVTPLWDFTVMTDRVTFTQVTSLSCFFQQLRNSIQIGMSRDSCHLYHPGLAWIFLPPANEVCEGYVFTGVCLSTWGGMCGCSRGGMCGCSGGVLGMHGCSRGGLHGCSRGGMCGCSQGACVVAPKGTCMVAPRGHVWLLQGACMGYDKIQRYDQWAGGTHPNGMHSCFEWIHEGNMKRYWSLWYLLLRWVNRWINMQLDIYLNVIGNEPLESKK